MRHCIIRNNFTWKMLTNITPSLEICCSLKIWKISEKYLLYSFVNIFLFKWTIVCIGMIKLCLLHLLFGTRHFIIKSGRCLSSLRGSRCRKTPSVFVRFIYLLLLFLYFFAVVYGEQRTHLACVTSVAVTNPARAILEYVCALPEYETDTHSYMRSSYFKIFYKTAKKI